MTTDTVKNAKMTTESVVNFVFFETLATEKSATGSSADGGEVLLLSPKFLRSHSTFKHSSQAWKV